MMNNKMLPSISQYMKDHVDSTKEWTDGNYACPFHDEKHGKSFSIRGSIWRCFGQCQCGGDVVSLHKHNFRIKTKEEAERSLFNLYHIDVSKDVSFVLPKVDADPVLARRRIAYNRALRAAKTVEQWLELDYILSKVPFDVAELELFCSKCGQR